MERFSVLLQSPKKIQWLIFALACLIYSNTIPNKWALDDSIIIHQNKYVQQGITGIPKIIKSDAFTGFYGEDINAVTGGRYRPLSQVFFAINANFVLATEYKKNAATAKNTPEHLIKRYSKNMIYPNVLHLFNVIWYGLLCLVIYRTLLLLFSNNNKEDYFKSSFLAFSASLLYAVHPLHTEAVANIKGLDEIFAMLGSMISLYCVLKLHIATVVSQPNKTKWLLGATVSYFLALLSKESAVTFIVIIPLALWFFTAASAKNIFKLTLPLVVPLVLFLGIRTAVLYQPNKGAIGEELMNDPFLVLDPNAQYAPLIENSSIKKLVNPNANTFTQMPYKNQLATNFYTYGVYLKLLFAPYPLTVDYYPRHIEIKSFADFSVLLSVLIHLFLLTWALLHIRKKNLISLGILYYFITFSIVSNLFFPIGTNMAERFMFMPSLGFCLVIACLFFALGNKISKPNTTSGFSKIYAVLSIIVCVLATLTFKRNLDWKDNFTLFSKDILVSKNSGKIKTDLAAEMINKAVSIKEKKLKEIEFLSVEEKQNALREIEQERGELLQQSIPFLNRALEIHPMSNQAWLKMANTQHFLGQFEGNDPKINLNYLQTALAAYKEAEFYKGAKMEEIIKDFKAICLMDLGKLMGQKFGDIQSAITYLEQAKVLRPKEPEVYLLLGTANSMLNNYEKTIEYTQKSLELRPNDRDTKQNLAVAYQQYAYANTAKRNLLPLAEKLLLEVYKEEKMLPDNDISKATSIFKTLDLLYKNATIQGNTKELNEYRTEILKLNPNALNN